MVKDSTYAAIALFGGICTVLGFLPYLQQGEASLTHEVVAYAGLAFVVFGLGMLKTLRSQSMALVAVLGITATLMLSWSDRELIREHAVHPSTALAAMAYAICFGLLYAGCMAIDDEIHEARDRRQRLNA